MNNKLLWSNPDIILSVIYSCSVQSSTYAFETLLNISSISSMRNHGPPFFGFYCPFEGLHAGKLDLVVHEGFLHHVVFFFKWGRETISLFEIKVG
ncbi:hypothetical protein CUMW_085040 [Citrus unshiu]|nr:hypothetical protein CUMW_085040 [Citrus unshiu]